MKNLYQNHILRRLVVYLVGSSIGLFSNAETIKNISHSQYINVQFAATSQAKQVNNLENLVDFNLIPANSNEIKEQTPEESTEITPKYLSETEIDSYLNNIYKKGKIPKIINRDFVKSLIKMESSGNVYAISPKGARGLMQLLPDAWKEVDKSNFDENCYNPQRNIEVGVKYLSNIYGHCRNNYPNWNESSDDGKREILAAAYNGGIGLLKKKEWNINQMPKETTSYVDSLKTSQAQSYSDNTKVD